MCGLVGHITNGGPTDQKSLYAAMDSMHHRGPDDSGVESFSTALLGHRRLSIIDTVGSPQPWQSDDKRYTLIFNGEIYNYLEIRSMLETDGVIFKTRGDTEVLLRAYEKFGEKCLERFNGMFAFAIWDEREKKLFAARDRLGEKPFFYTQTKSGVIFASEIQAILCFKNHIDTSINNKALTSYIAYQFISGTDTIYKNIQQLSPAHCFVYQNGNLHIQRYWELPPPTAKNRKTNALVEEMSSLIADSVRLRLRSDVPLGAFLSGGLDSASIVALMRNEHANVESFTISFDQESYDESKEARLSSEVLGTNHFEGKIKPDFVEDIPKMLQVIGQPFADTSILPTWYLCQFTKGYVTVALSGDGADELFGGYKRYLAANVLEKTKWFPYSVLGKMISWWPDNTEYYGKSWSKKIRLLLQFVERQKQSPFDPTPQVFLPSERERLFDREYYHDVSKNEIAEYNLERYSPTEQMMYIDAVKYLPDDILIKVDSMSMAHSLEVRTPFLDHRLVEFCSVLPLEYKINKMKQKYLLKKIAEKILPPSIIQRPKHGFAAPVADLLKTKLKKSFEEYVLDDHRIDFFDLKEVELLWGDHLNGRKDNGMKLWTLYIFYCWYHQMRSQ